MILVWERHSTMVVAIRRIYRAPRQVHLAVSRTMRLQRTRENNGRHWLRVIPSDSSRCHSSATVPPCSSTNTSCNSSSSCNSNSSNTYNNSSSSRVMVVATAVTTTHNSNISSSTSSNNNAHPSAIAIIATIACPWIWTRPAIMIWPRSLWRKRPPRWNRCVID